MVTEATTAFEAYDYTGALEVSEQFFWSFCDDYLELVKERAYAVDQPGSGSARSTLILALDVMLRLLAPIMPYATEEVWSWWKAGSIHQAAWPQADEVGVGADPGLLTDVATALIAIRGAKSSAKASMKTEITRAAFSGSPAALEHLRAAETDLRAVGRITGPVDWSETDGPVQVDTTLAVAPTP